MNRRHVLALGGVAVLFLLAGCIGPFSSGSISDDTLDAEAEYAWDSDADVHVQVDVGEFRAVYDLDGETAYELSRSTYYRDQPVDIEAVRYQYPNGTELTGSELDIDQGRSTTYIDVPDGNGTLAFSAPAGSKRVEIPALVEGTYTVELPRGHRVNNFFLSDVSPSQSSDEVIDDRQILTWSDNDDDINIQFHLWRDHYLFWGLVVGLTGIAIGGVFYYRRQIRRLADRRREIGLDVHDDDDD